MAIKKCSARHTHCLSLHSSLDFILRFILNVIFGLSYRMFGDVFACFQKNEVEAMCI
jgi:hypothetical protein